MHFLTQLYKKNKLVILCLLLLPLTWYGIKAGWNNVNSDFPNYYVSAQLLLKGQLYDAYNVDIFNRHIQSFNKDARGLFVMYPPTTALLALPISCFDLLTAKRIWILLSLSAGIGIISLVSKLCSLKTIDAACLLLLSGFNLYNDIMLGQVYVCMLFLLLSGWYYYIKQAKLSTGLTWGFIAAIKFLPLFFIPFLLLKKQYRLVAVLGLSFVLIHCITWAVGGLSAYSAFIHVFIKNYVEGQVANTKALSLQYQSIEVLTNLLPQYLSWSPVWLMLFIKTGWKCFWFYIAFITCKKHVGSANFLLVCISSVMLILLLFENGSASYHLLFCLFPFIAFFNMVKNKQHQILLLVLFAAMGFVPTLIKFFEPGNLLMMFARLWCLSLFSLWFFIGFYKQKKITD